MSLIATIQPTRQPIQFAYRPPSPVRIIFAWILPQRTIGLNGQRTRRPDRWPKYSPAQYERGSVIACAATWKTGGDPFLEVLASEMGQTATFLLSKVPSPEIENAGDQKKKPPEGGFTIHR
jgi:hypothetical protein